MILFTMPWKKDGVEVVCKTVRMDDPKLVDRLYDAGTSMAAVAPEKQSVFSQHYCRLCDTDRDFYSPWTLAQQENDGFYGKWRPRRHDVLWKKQRKGLCEVFYGH